MDTETAPHTDRARELINWFQAQTVLASHQKVLLLRLLGAVAPRSASSSARRDS